MQFHTQTAHTNQVFNLHTTYTRFVASGHGFDEAGPGHAGSDVDTNDCDEDCDKVLVYPRRKAGEEKMGSERPPVVVTREYLKSHFNIPLASVAKNLNLSATVLKQLCRRFGIQKWPYARQKVAHNSQYRSQDEDSETRSEIVSRPPSAATTPTRAAAETKPFFAKSNPFSARNQQQEPVAASCAPRVEQFAASALAAPATSFSHPLYATNAHPSPFFSRPLAPAARPRSPSALAPFEPAAFEPALAAGPSAAARVDGSGLGGDFPADALRIAANVCATRRSLSHPDRPDWDPPL